MTGDQDLLRLGRYDPHPDGERFLGIGDETRPRPIVALQHFNLSLAEVAHRYSRNRGENRTNQPMSANRPVPLSTCGQCSIFNEDRFHEI